MENIYAWKKHFIIAAILGILIIATFLAWTTLPRVGPTAPGIHAVSQEPAIPGDNLTLGQDTSPTLGAYLIGYNGMTLYTYAADGANTSTCTGSCATAWPPYTVTSTNNLVAESPVSGTLGTLIRADGTFQVTYDGHPLYFYAGDTKPEVIGGEGIDGFHIAKP